ncbi:dihydroorotate dehydrogenase-like protein [soil metagenome]
MVDLETTYMGMRLAHPVIASASPLSKDTDGIKRLEDGGASAIVMFSLFEEQIRGEQEALEVLSSAGSNSFAESLSYFPPVDAYRVGPDRYLELIRRARESVRVPIIASLNGITNEGWIDYAKQMHQAGASAIELNVYLVAADLDMTGRDVEQRFVDILGAVKASVPIPVALKKGPLFSAFGNMARRLDEAGADALVLFNRFYQPDFDLERLEVVPNLELSTPSEIRLPLLWIAVLAGRIKASLAATTGVRSGVEVVKYLLAGADAVMSTSAVLDHGPAHLGRLVTELREWLEARDYSSVTQMKGAMSQLKVADPASLVRANYIKVLETYKTR